MHQGPVHNNSPRDNSSLPGTPEHLSPKLGHPTPGSPGGSAASRREDIALTEEYIHKIGTACYHLRRRGDHQEADKVAWRVLHRLQVLTPEDVTRVDPCQLALAYGSNANGPLSTIFLQIATSLVNHGKFAVGYEFARRAVFLFPDQEALSVLMQICGRERLGGNISKLDMLKTTREAYEWYLERRFKVSVDSDGR
ncbi:MAG: hypothetical protein EBZ48_01555, partial [Proteobacteria bacterium]|nr:hypothetical protein [Pseudomonadota bacterium]